MSQPSSSAAASRLVGQVREVWRFPVKSMQGEQVGRVAFDAHAMDGDRRLGIRDLGTGKLWSAKRHGVLLEAAARTVEGGVEITLPGGGTFFVSDDAHADHGDIDAALCEWLGADVRLDRVAADREATNGVYEFAFDIDDAPDAEWFDIDMPPGSFADLAHVHLLTTASIAAASVGHPDGNWDTRRFRPSVLVDTGDQSGFVEDEWLGRDIRVGGLTVHIDLPTIRCVMPTRAQPASAAGGTLVRDKAVSRAIADLHGFNLGAYASVVTPGAVAPGDDVLLLG
jgi:uncharacterized protein YcbX